MASYSAVVGPPRQDLTKLQQRGTKGREITALLLLLAGAYCLLLVYGLLLVNL
jgi:hypothetical protein